MVLWKLYKNSINFSWPQQLQITPEWINYLGSEKPGQLIMNLTFYSFISHLLRIVLGNLFSTKYPKWTIKMSAHTNILPCKVKNKIENMKFSLTMSNLSYQIKTPYIPEIENRFFKIHNSTDIIIQHLCVNSGILYNPGHSIYIWTVRSELLFFFGTAK